MIGEAVSVAAGLFEIADGQPRLIGSRCTACGTSYFPQALSCRNPACDAKMVERTLLPPQGTLYSYTVQGYRPPPLFRKDDWAPYAIGVVELDDGLRVMGMLSGCALDTIAIGMPVRLGVAPLYSDDQGRDVLTYMFLPDEARTVVDREASR